MEEQKNFHRNSSLFLRVFDAYTDDPVGGLGLGVSDFADLTKIVVRLAEECCDSRIVFMFRRWL